MRKNHCAKTVDPEKADEKLKVNRWLKALEIAKIIFEAEGYHSVYLEEIEDLIKTRVVRN